MKKQANTHITPEIPEPSGIVSVNARGGASSGIGGKIVFALLAIAIMFIACLFAYNRHRAAQQEADRARTQSEKEAKRVEQLRHRKIFASGDPAAPYSLPAMGDTLACPAGTAAQIKMTADGKAVLDASGLPKQECGKQDLQAAVIGTPTDDPPFNAAPDPGPTPSAVTKAPTGSFATGSRYGGDIVIPSSAGLGTPKMANQADEQSARIVPVRYQQSSGSMAVGSTIPSSGRSDRSIGAEAQGPIGPLLDSSGTVAASARMIGNRDMILPQGRSIDCNLTVRVVNEVSGMATCMLSSNLYSDNGRVVLAERGSTAVGEYVATMAQGQRRLFILWTRLQTPKGVVIDIQSPGTDALGTSGLPGHVENRWAERIGAAVLLSLVEDAIAYKTAKANPGDGSSAASSIAILPNATQTGRSLAEKILDNTINIKPTLYKNQGDRASIFVSRDLDFGSVYVLRTK